VFLLVIDSFGIGQMPDAENFGDKGSDTLASCYYAFERMQEENSQSKVAPFFLPNLRNLGLFNIDGVSVGEKAADINKNAAYGRFSEKSMGKDTTVGHFEMMGNVCEKPFPVYPEGFPKEVIDEFEKLTGRGVLCNKPYSGTEVIKDYGEEHIKTGDLIVYTSADSVFQIAAHEDIVPIDELYSICKKARKLLNGEHAVARVIARPFVGKYPDFKRTSNRHDFSVEPFKRTVLDILKDENINIYPIGKIYDIFAGKSLSKPHYTKNNLDGLNKTLEAIKSDFEGFCFINLVDTDSVYGHRNDSVGYAKALMEIDSFIPEFIKNLKEDDLLIITADHGCDPGTESTDHSREYIPFMAYGKKIKNINLGTLQGFDKIGATVLEALGSKECLDAESFYKDIKIMENEL